MAQKARAGNGILRGLSLLLLAKEERPAVILGRAFLEISFMEAR